MYMFYLSQLLDRITKKIGYHKGTLVYVLTIKQDNYS
jgi:hypothetical protein